MSSKGKVDPRVRRTRSWLTEALFELMKKHELSDINIAMITKKAGVSRQTFYLHFKTREDVLSAYIDGLFETFEEEAEFKETLSDQDNDYGVAVRLFEVLARHPEWIRLIKNEALFPLVQEHIKVKCRVMLDQFLVQFGSPVCSPAVIDYTAEYVAGGAVMLIGRWIDNGMDASPSEIGRIFHELTMPVLQKAFYDDAVYIRR